MFVDKIMNHLNGLESDYYVKLQLTSQTHNKKKGEEWTIQHGQSTSPTYSVTLTIST